MKMQQQLPSDGIVGFTGTRNGMTDAQRQVTLQQLRERGPFAGAVHGDCVGADEDFDELCKREGIHVMVRPCTFAHLRAFCESEVIAEEKRPMARNRDIVAQSDCLIACPPNKERIKSGSGTWATIGFAEKAGIELVVIFPDGTIRGKEG